MVQFERMLSDIKERFKVKRQEKRDEVLTAYRAEMEVLYSKHRQETSNRLTQYQQSLDDQIMRIKDLMCQREGIIKEIEELVSEFQKAVHEIQ